MTSPSALADPVDRASSIPRTATDESDTVVPQISAWLRRALARRTHRELRAAGTRRGMAVLEAVADGSWETASLEPVENLRERGPYVDDPHE